MSPQNNHKAVQFPPVDADREAKINSLLKKMGELMDVEIEITRVTIVQAKVVGDRQEITTMLRTIANNEKKKQDAKPTPTPQPEGAPKP